MRFTTSTTAPAGRRSDASPARPASPTPPSPRSSPRRPCPRGAPSSCSSRHMDGDTHRFHELWLAASAPEHPTDSGTRIAGRVPELAAVRRHLETGTGLLLVTGEAGIGKTTLVAAARDQLKDRVLIASGNCLPLSTEIPLLPVAEALRQVHRADGWTPAARAAAVLPGATSSRPWPRFSRSCPTAGDVLDPDDRWSRQRLFSAIAELLEAMSARQPSALLMEDLHWADELSLDLVEHLLRTPGRQDPGHLAARRPRGPAGATGLVHAHPAHRRRDPAGHPDP